MRAGRNKGMCCHFGARWLPWLSVHGCAHLWLLLMDVTAHHSFSIFSEHVIGDSVTLGTGGRNEQDRQGAYSQGTWSLLETALNKDSIWLIIRIHRFYKNEVWGKSSQLFSFKSYTNNIHKQVHCEAMKIQYQRSAFLCNQCLTTGNYILHLKITCRLVCLVDFFFPMTRACIFSAIVSGTQEHILYNTQIHHIWNDNFK